MSFMNMLLVVFFVGILPLSCGIYPAIYERKEGGDFFIARIYVYGWVLMFALFEVLCVPYVVLLKSFRAFSKVYLICVLILAVASMVLGVWRLNKQGRTSLAQVHMQEKAKGNRKIGYYILWGAVILFVLVQMVFLYFNGHMDGDDSYYIAQSVLTDYYDTMFQRDAYTGMPIGLDERHALSVNPIFITWLANMCRMHPAAMAHSVLAPVLIMLMYCVYALLGRALLKEHRSYVPVFVLLVNVWYIWGNVSIYTAETFMYTRTWQGKAMFANIVIPFVVYCLVEVLQSKRRTQWAMLFLLTFVGAFVTTAAVYLIPLVYGIVGVFAWVREKSFRPCFHLILCCIPSMLLGIVYCYLIVTWGHV